MKLYEDYRNSKEDKNTILLNPNEYNVDFLDLIDFEKMALVKNKLYPRLCLLAKEQVGKAELEIDKAFFDMTLTYIGKELILDKAIFQNLLLFSEIVNLADTCIISIKDSFFVMMFGFILH